LGPAYNPCMFHVPVPLFVAVAALERATLLANHVLGSEEVATDKLRPHAGRCIQLELRDLPALLPSPPGLVFKVTPAGLLEWCGPQPTEAVDLHVRVDASNPAGLFARLLVGDRPQVEVQGDAGLATDLNWLIDNLRWDVEDDLARVVGDAPAHQIATLSRAFAGGLRSMLQQLNGAIDRSDGRRAR
jgi:ubiquinone biosynthesis accessory factor UbiJ